MPGFDPAPTSLEAVLDPAWLSAMLGANWPGTTVGRVEVVETLATMATKVRLAIEIEGDDQPVPTRLCIKGVLTETGAAASTSIVETLFYRDAAAALPVRVPGHVHADLNAAGDNGLVVMHDVIAAGGSFCSALNAFTPDEALEGLDQLAALHAAGWQGTSPYALPWIPRFLDQITSRQIMPREALQALLDGPRGEQLPAGVRDAERLQRALQNYAGQVRGRPNCLVHGDAHAGNVYRDAQGRLGLVDWQVLQQGEWAQDVAYHLAAILTPEDRRTHERALLDHYRASLKSLGGPEIDADEGWARYRAGMIYGYFLWSITRKVEPVLIHEFVRRLGLAVNDLESFAAVGA